MVVRVVVKYDYVYYVETKLINGYSLPTISMEYKREDCVYI